MSYSPEMSTSSSTHQNVIEHHVLEIVKGCVSNGQVRGLSVAQEKESIGAQISHLHERISKLFSRLMLEYGGHVTSIAAQYASRLIEQGILFVGDELDDVIVEIAGNVYRVERDLAKNTPM